MMIAGLRWGGGARGGGVVRVIAALLGVGVPMLAVAAPGGSSPVYGGEAVASCAWPTTVFLGGCTGTLIHPEIVMYAAHCGEGIPEVYFGEDFSDPEAPIEGFTVATEYCAVNPASEAPMSVEEFRAADFAFCKLAEPVLDVPIVPPLVGCEATVLVPGQSVTLVGFGLDEDDGFAVKRAVTTVLHYIDDVGVAVIGGNGKSSCNGDSGGPAFVQLPDGSWRAFGIVSGPNVGNCGDPGWYPTSFLAVPFIEERSGIDVTPCHFANGEWNPSPACGEFPLEPDDGAGKQWAQGCAGGPSSPWGSACGPAYDDSPDGLAPTATITSPKDRARFDTEDGEDNHPVTVKAEAIDDISGVRELSLAIGGVAIEGGLRRNPPWTWNVLLPPGVWTLQIEATDWAGNTALSREVVIGVDQDPPPAPEPGTSSDGGAVGSSGDAPEGTGTGAAASTGGESADSTGGAPMQHSSEGGCACRSAGEGSATPGALASLLAAWMVGGAARRRRRARLLLAACTIAACGGDSGGVATESSSTGAETSTATASLETSSEASTGGSTTGDASSSDGGSSGVPCEPGTEACHCDEDFACNADLTCMLDTCVACETGTFACPCAFAGEGEEGTCDEGLLCFGGLCALPQPCPYVEDGECDEPFTCLPGTDGFDCCATQPGVCEERGKGGACPTGSDPDDCGGEGSSSGGSGGTEATSTDASSSTGGTDASSSTGGTDASSSTGGTDASSSTGGTDASSSTGSPV